MSSVKFKSTHHPLYNDFSKLVDTFLGKDMSELSRFGGNFSPAVNVSESTEAYTLEVVAPGREKSDFKIHIEKDLLTLSYDKKASEEAKANKYTRKEFEFKSFKRSFTLSENVDVEHIGAKYEKGVLIVSLPKKEVVEVETKRTIDVS